MMRSCIRQAVRAFAGAAFFSFALAANAGGITLNDSNCDSFSLSGPPGSQVLTCVVSNAPTGCSIQGPTTGTNGQAVTLTAICSTGSPTTYAWSGGNCQGLGTQSCQAVDTNVTRSYSVVISNAIGPGSPNPATKQVVWSNALPAPPSNCSITPSPASLPATGGSVSLTAQCASGGPVDTWIWSNATYTTTSGNTASATISATTTFKVAATNAGGTANPSVSVAVGGGGGGPISCSGFLGTRVLTLTWPQNFNGTLGMGVLDASVLVFTTGNNTGSGSISITTAGNNAATHHDYTLSDTACDFGAGRKQFVSSSAPTFRFNVTTSGGTGTTLKTNTTYYINVKNSEDGTGCQSQGLTCDLYPVNLQGP
jgi:hypothetical protein